MKKLHCILLVIIIGCVSQRDIIHEDTLYVTRKYIGNFIELRVDKKATCIVTTDALFYIIGKPLLEIPDSSRCYVKYIPERLVGSNTSVWILYFTWDGTEDLFVLRQNKYTGEIY